MEIIGLQGIPLINPGDDVAEIILNSLEGNNIKLENGDILLIAQTIISKSISRLKNLKQITPSPEALFLYDKITPKAKEKNIPIKTPEHLQAILDESKDIIKAEHVFITETHQGFICANAGIDKSNIEGEDNVSLLPENSDLEARKIHDIIKKATGKDIAIIITDSFGRPFRVGAIGVALGIYGIKPIIDKRGALDLFGHELQSTIIGHVDNLAAAAQLVMGETNEGIPVALIRGHEFEFTRDVSIKSILRDKKSDIFRKSDLHDNFIDLLKKRRSYKSDFDSREIKREMIIEAIEIARWAPSAHNSQPWRFIILEKNKRRNVLIDKMNEKLKNDLRKDEKKEAYIGKKIIKTRNNFIQAPYLVLVCMDITDLEKYPDQERSENEFLMNMQSVSSSITYFLLALEAKNLAACWYCAPLFTKEIVRNELNLPQNYVPIAFITVGYPLKEQKVPHRKKLSKIIFKI